MNKPTKFPCAEMEKLRDNYVINRDGLRRDYVEASAKLLLGWFFENYEDPAQSTPCDEGEYVFIWGQCDTREVIEDGLEEMVAEDLVDEIVEAALDEMQSAYGSEICGDICVPLFGRYDEDDNSAPDEAEEPTDADPPQGL